MGTSAKTHAPGFKKDLVLPGRGKEDGTIKKQCCDNTQRFNTIE